MESTGAPVPSFRDRRRGLRVWGWVLIAAGGLALLFAFLFLALLVLAARGGLPTAAPLPARSVALDVLMYAGLAAVLGTLGVGSLRARRWARALTLTLAWVWLVGGAVSTLGLAVLLPRMASMLPGTSSAPGLFACMAVFLIAFALSFFVVLPLLLLLFYRKPDVLRTVEAASPSDWTDAVPVSILSVVLALAAAAVMCGIAPLAIRALPVGGIVLTGASAAAACIALGLVSAFLAFAAYRRKPAAWWGLMAMQVLGLVNFFTFRKIDMEALLTQMGYPAEQARMAGQMDLFGSPVFLGLMAAAWCALLVFLLSIRREFRAPAGVGSRP